jgi:hypothetical protein
MTKIFQKSIDYGELTDDWLKCSTVFKKGDVHKAENYRPVSLTSVTCKLLEHMAFDGFMSLSSLNTPCSPIFRVFMLNPRSMVDFSSVDDVLFVKTENYWSI